MNKTYSQLLENVYYIANTSISLNWLGYHLCDHSVVNIKLEMYWFSRQVLFVFVVCNLFNHFHLLHVVKKITGRVNMSYPSSWFMLGLHIS